MQKWEYCLLFSSKSPQQPFKIVNGKRYYFPPIPDMPNKDSELESIALNTLGAEGWEVIADAGGRWTLKRPLEG